MDRRKLLVETAAAFGLALNCLLQLIALGGEIGKRNVELTEPARPPLSSMSASVTFCFAPLRFSALAADSCCSAFLFAREPAQGGLGIAGKTAFPLDIGGQLHQPLVEFAHPLAGAYSSCSNVSRATTRRCKPPRRQLPRHEAAPSRLLRQPPVLPLQPAARTRRNDRTAGP